MRLSDFNNNKTEKVEENVTEKDIMDKYNQYKDLSSDQLSQELLKRCQGRRRTAHLIIKDLKACLIV